MPNFEADARIYVMVRAMENGKPPRSLYYIIELKNFTRIETRLTMTGVSTASVSLNNRDDQMYVDATMENELDSALIPFAKNEKYIKKYINPARNKARENFYNITSLTQKNSFLNTEYVLPFGEMDRIWIDFKGRDGKWYAAFTGIITSITDSYDATGTPTVVLSCKDLRRFWGLTLLNTQNSIKVLDQTEQDLVQKGMSPYVNTFSGYTSGDTIARKVLQIINECYTGYKGTEGLKTYPYSTVTDRSFRTPFWLLPNQVGQVCERKYVGLSNVRSDEGLMGTVKPNLYQSYSIAVLSSELNLSEYENSQFLVDESFGSTNLKTYEKMIRQAFELYNMARVPASEVLNRVADIGWLDLYQDAMGNLIYQYPRYDDIPEANSSLYSEKMHGDEYVIVDDGFLSYSSTVNEENRVTSLSVGAREDWGISLDGDLQLSTNTGYAIAGREETNKYGVRAKVLQSVMLGFLQKEELNRYALACRNMLNTYVRTGRVVMNQRPDLQLGRTMYNVERNLLYYVRSISNDYVHGSHHRTSVELVMGHDPKNQIGNPFKQLLQSVSNEKYNKVAFADSTPISIENPVSSKYSTFSIKEQK